MNREDIVRIIKKHAMTSRMVLEELGISRAALSSLKTRGILVPVMDGVYLREDVMARKAEQKGLQAKYAEGSKFLQMLQKRVDPKITAVKKTPWSNFRRALGPVRTA